MQANSKELWKELISEISKEILMTIGHQVSYMSLGRVNDEGAFSFTVGGNINWHKYF